MDTALDLIDKTEEQYWEALVKRDVRFDGVFFYGVKTTGIYCRPGCKSRQPQRENIRFFHSTDEAEAAGFRPCKRCSPAGEDTAHAQNSAVLKACEIIAQSERPPVLQELAGAVGLSPFYFQRLFKRIVGITPRQYFEEKRAGRTRDNLLHTKTITDAIYDSGFGSNSRFYSQAGDVLGMQPSVYKRGGIGMRVRYTTVNTHLGWVLVAVSERGVCAIEFGENPAALEKTLASRFPGAVIAEDDAGFADWVSKITDYLEAPHQGLDLPLDIQGTAFQRQVWQALRAIPFGETASYADIAQKIGKPKAVRAVAQACAANKIALAIPCHRVVQSDGGLGGYRWGRARKQKILDLERAK